ncbi:MAG TPA: HEAT repeat domain-containing protein [Gemmatimonadaceae bacterium]|nr:HEAT repeat domain-containing protein [Gemmatimonadaceae bacterium]
MTELRSNLALVEDSDEPPFEISVVTDVLRQFGKAARAQQLYASNNPMHARAMTSVRESLKALWDHASSLELQITDSTFAWLGRTVIEEPGRTSDSLPWLFYKDGVRELTMLPGFEDEELAMLLEIVQRTRLASADDDDMLTRLWEREFGFLQYKYVELAVEVGAPLLAHGIVAGSKIVSPRAVESQESEVLSASSFARMEEYDSTLYFLEDSEIDYLQREIKSDFSSDLRSRVVASLLDTYESELDPTVREEIAAILEQFFLVMLSLGHFGPAAYIIREAKVTAGRARNVLDTERERLLALADGLSEQEAIEQLLQTLEATALRPPQNDLHELLMQLHPKAMASILGWLGGSTNAELRALLESAASRMAASHTTELVRLISVEDGVVAFEAIRRAGSLKAAAAVPALAGAIAQGTPEMRIAAVTALSQIGSAGAMEALGRALEDEDTDIRIAAVRVLATRGHSAAVPRIEARIRTSSVRDGSLAEKMAFLESYGALAGEAGVGFLSGILNSRGFFHRREPAELRACAAIALGKIGTSLAMEALQQAGGDGELIVRNAVSRAIRGG